MRGDDLAFIYCRIQGPSQQLAFFSVRILKWIHSILLVHMSTRMNEEETTPPPRLYENPPNTQGASVSLGFGF